MSALDEKGSARPAAARWPARGVLVLGALGLASVLVGWLVAMSVGTVLERDTDRAWDGDRLYVVGASGQRVGCVVTAEGGDRGEGGEGGDGAQEVVQLGDGPRNVGLDLAAASQRFTPGGRHLSEPGPATLRCDGDTRVTTGATALLTLPAEAGLWVVAPAALLVVAGSALGRRRRRS